MYSTREYKGKKKLWHVVINAILILGPTMGVHEAQGGGPRGVRHKKGRWLSHRRRNSGVSTGGSCRAHPACTKPQHVKGNTPRSDPTQDQRRKESTRNRKYVEYMYVFGLSK